MIFHGTIIKDRAPLYLGLYVDDFVYFSTDKEVEKSFEQQLKSKTNVDFMGNVSHFLGHKFQWHEYSSNDSPHLKVHISKTAFADTLIDEADLSDSSKTTLSPYRSGYPVDAVPDPPPNSKANPALQDELRHLVGSLNWISQGSRPDLATITSMIAKYQNKPHEGHLQAAKYAIRYLKQSKDLGIVFDSQFQNKIHSFTQFPLDPLHELTDSNWGPQDQKITKHNRALPLFKSRSMSGHIIFMYGPLH